MNTKYKIAICFDGTWNTVECPGKYSNVKKLKDRIVKKNSEEDGTIITKTFYVEGPGTRPQTRKLDGAFAFNLPKNIFDAYRWLSITYCDILKSSDAPEIYLFGFSRGSYIAHVFSWILNDIGITSELSLIQKAVDVYMSKDLKKLEQLKEKMDPAKVFTPVIRMMGLWDMVCAPLDFYKGFHDGKRAPIVQNIYHAMSLDEKRDFFPVLKYKKGDERVNQRWFSGVHSDVGGGYEDTVLSDITLDWMLDNAIDEDLIIKEITASKDVPLKTEDFLNMQIHDESGSQKNFRLFEEESIDDSVYRRMEQDPSYHPLAKNFPDKKADYV